MLINNIAYTDYSKRNDIHGTVLYPAVMVAPLQKDILFQLLEHDEITSVFDPFHGSGTALYEASELSSDIRLIGCDINPLANLITKVKLQGVNSRIHRDIDILKQFIDTPTDLIEYKFPNMQKWFRDDIYHSLKVIRTAIMSIEDNQNRLFFWYILCDIIRKFSNTRSATYKLHIKDEDSISRLENNVISQYINSIEKNVDKFRSCTDNFELYKCDILEKIIDFEDHSFDISITSPPYGENATTVPYGQFSMLSLYTIDSNDLELEGWELENYSKIDNKSLGNKAKEIEIDEYGYQLINFYINRIVNEKRIKVLHFFTDYFKFLNELCRVTNKYIVMTLGNRTVDRVQIDLTSITRDYLESKGYENIQFAQREIPIKRIPKTTSNVGSTPVSSMNCEYIIIHKRNE